MRPPGKALGPDVARDMLFVSHANPEDNEFARWLTLRLTAAGYPVWCDLTKLLGGERFWSEIEGALRTRTIKFVYVLSRHSNDKPGPRDELDLALSVQRQLKLRDFVIPLWVDSLLKTTDFNIRLASIAAIPFHVSWARGLDTLLRKLEADSVPKRHELGPGAVTSWWRENFGAREGVSDIAEQVVSNWYCLEPTTLYFHGLTRAGIGSLRPTAALPHAVVQHNQYLVTFAPASDLISALGPELSISETVERSLNGSTESHEPRLWTYAEQRDGLSSLLRAAWESLLSARQLPTHTFANGAKGFYFRKGFAAADRVSFIDAGGNASWRAMVGFKTHRRRDGVHSLRYWHFCLEAKPTTSPIVGFTMKPHVLFSDDGTTIWDNHERLQRARRSQCANWWNDRWRGLIMAAVTWLAGGESSVALPVGSATALNVARQPMSLSSPVSFDDKSLKSEIGPDDDSDRSGAESDGFHDEDALDDDDEVI